MKSDADLAWRSDTESAVSHLFLDRQNSLDVSSTMFDASALLYRCTFPSEASAFTLRRFLLYCACEDLEANGVPPDA